MEDKLFIFSIGNEIESVKATIAKNLDEAYDKITDISYYDDLINDNSFAELVRRLDRHNVTKEVFDHFVNGEIEPFKHKLVKYCIEMDGLYDIRVENVIHCHTFFICIPDYFEGIDSIKVISIPKDKNDSIAEAERLLAIDIAKNNDFRAYVNNLVGENTLLNNRFLLDEDEFWKAEDENEVNRTVKNKIYKYFGHKSKYADAYYKYYLNGEVLDRPFEDEMYEFISIREYKDFGYCKYFIYKVE